MSVIPYDNHRDVVLRNANSVVYRDPRSKQLIRNTVQDIDAQGGHHGRCPTCNRPWSPEHGEEGQPDFIDADYFRMLAQSLPGSAQTSPPPSPIRRIARPRVSSPTFGETAHGSDRTGGLRKASTARLPLDAELVGSSPAPPDQAHGISEAAFAPQYFEKFFIVEKELGRGGRGVVLLVKHVLDGVTLGQFACKRVPIGDDHTWLEKVLVEVQLLQTLSHQNLVSYRHVWLEDYQLNTFGPSVPCAFILQQYCNGGDMHNYICGSALASTTTQELKDRIRRRSKGEHELPSKQNEPKKLHFEQIYSFFRDITAGLRFLHLNDFVHRDLKPSNCLLHTTGHETRVLVSDFGEVQYEYATRKSTGATGTISYCAPEVLQRLLPDGPFGNFTFKSDIFSLGMILHFLCFANLPYRAADVLHEEREDADLLKAEIASWQGFDGRRLRPELPNKLYDFLERLLSLNPDLRPTADEVLLGIRTGGLEEPPELRRRNSAAPDESISGARRVQAVDSPLRAKSPLRGPERQRASTSALANILPAQRRQRQASRDPPVPNSHINGASDSAVEEDSETLETRSSEIIVRPKVSSPIPSPRQSQSPPPDLMPRPPLLLPAPVARSGYGSRLAMLFNMRSPSRLIRVLILSIKLLSTLHPCTSSHLGINPIFAYPILTLAMIEMTLPDYRLWKALLAMVVHVLALAFAITNRSLCVVRKELWESE